MTHDSVSSARRPILVTGVPRSGTTWLARWLAGGRGLALAGREPMNPRGRQYALGHTIEGWARITEPTPRQRRVLATAYRGLNPWVYSRYGTRQWAAPLPTTRLVIKDPFALLSVPAIVEVTRALPVLVYRHPGAVLASYRRMGWTPDLTEVQRIVETARSTGGPDLPDIPASTDPASAEAMGRFWSTLHALALADLDARGTDCLVVAHHELASSGPAGGRTLTDLLGIAWSPTLEAALSAEAGDAASAGPDTRTNLHNFDRAPAEVAEAWRRHLDAADVETIERITTTARSALDARRLVLPRPSGGPQD